jgi:ABC-type multidrug transport system fused ATPase/permease subunit
MYFFGTLTNIFINQFTSKTLANFEFRFELVDILDTDCFLFIDPQILFSGFINFTALSGGIVNCSDDFFLISPSLTFNVALECGVTRLARCLDDEEFIPLVNRYVVAFGIIGAVVVLVGAVQVFAFQVTSDRQTKRIKERFFHALLYQEAGWFDTTSSGELSSRLSR